MTISTLPDNVLVEIFSLCRTDEVVHETPSCNPWPLPWKWQRLAHVCRTWRYIIFASPLRLGLELHCTHGTPVKKKLGHLPSFPIVISYCGPFFHGVDQDNLFAALENRDRVRVVKIRVSYTIFERLVTVMQEPFPALTHLWFAPGTFLTMPPALPDTFLGGSAPRLQTIHIYGIPFPAAPTLLSSAHDLVEVDLYRIPPAGYIPPEAMVASLGTLPRLKCLNFEFEWGMSYPDRMRLLPITRTVLPALTRLYFKGLFRYFEDFVAQIDAPRLNGLRVEYHPELEVTDFQIPQLCKFVNRSESFKLSRFIEASLFIKRTYAIGIDLDRRPQSWFYLSFPRTAVHQVLSQIVAMLFKVNRLFIISNSHFENTGGRIRWRELFLPFTSVRALSVEGAVSWDIHLALNDVTGDMVAEVLPALELLCLMYDPEPADSEYITLGEFITARQNVGHPVTIVGDEEFEERLNTLDVSE